MLFPQPSTGQNSPGQDRAELQEIQNHQVVFLDFGQNGDICKSFKRKHKALFATILLENA